MTATSVMTCILGALPKLEVTGASASSVPRAWEPLPPPDAVRHTAA